MMKCIVSLSSPLTVQLVPEVVNLEISKLIAELPNELATGAITDPPEYISIVPTHVLPTSQQGRWIDMSLCGVSLRPIVLNMRSVCAIQPL
jgi:hypothetical protein